MPKLLFYSGTAFCLFLALTSAAESMRELRDGTVALGALPIDGGAPFALILALLGGMAIAMIFLRMAALLAARDLFGAFLALFSVSATAASLTWLVLLQWRLIEASRRGAELATLPEMHYAATMLLGWFVAVSILTVRPYFRIQASRFLSAIVSFPLPLFALILIQELFVSRSQGPLPASTPASIVFFAVLSVLFFAVSVHCIRHRHLFIETTNLRELLDARVDPAARHGRPVRIAFDS